MNDVEYYVDMPDFLAHHFRPILLHTVQPSAVCKDAGEYKYTFVDDDEIDYYVSGGGHFTHKLWNWAGDSVAAVRTFCWIPITYSVFALERRRIDDDHSLVLLAPVRKFYGWHAWLAMYRAPSKTRRTIESSGGRFY